MQACPLLARLLPLSGSNGILGVALSGAGPSVLLIADAAKPTADVIATIREAAGSPPEVIETTISTGAFQQPAP
jgi:homoserine kinase